MLRKLLPIPVVRFFALGTGWLALCALAAAAAGPARASALPADAAPADVEASFERFAAEWLRETRRLSAAAPASPARASAQLGAGGDALASAPEWSIEIRPTRDASVPYLGLLRYVEERSDCAEPKQVACPKTATRVTEIFRFEGGRWVY